MGQSEIVILLQCLPDEKCLPKDIFNHFVQLYRDALAGRNSIYLLKLTFTDQKHTFLSLRKMSFFFFLQKSHFCMR